MLNTLKSKFTKSNVSLLVIFSLAFLLRFYQITLVPPGLYIDEVSIGVNAHSIVTEGVDEHGESYPLFFEAFGEYKMPVYIYAAAMSEMVFGKGEFALRLPSALAGSATVLVLYLFAKEILTVTKKGKHSIRNAQYTMPAVAALLLAISPWHLQFTRAGFEASVAVFFYLTFLLLFTKFVKNKNFTFLATSLLLAALTLYTYQAFRAITPLTLVFLYIYAFLTYRGNLKKLLLGAAIFTVLMIPMINFTLTGAGMERFAQTSAFAEFQDRSPETKFTMYPMIFLQNYLEFFAPNFLFSEGDNIGRHQIPDFGLMYKWQFPFLLLGIFWLIKQKKTFFSILLFFILLTTPIPAALTQPTPHTLRSLLMVVPLTIIISLGIVYAAEIFRKKYKIAFITLLFAITLWEGAYYMHYYYDHYPKVNVIDWGGGYKTMIEKVTDSGSEYDEVVVEDSFTFVDYYFKYYAPSQKITIVDNGWAKPDAWEDKNVLFIRGDYKTEANEKVVDRVLLKNQNSDTFAELWQL